MSDKGRRTLVLLGLAGMSLCLVFSLLFRQADPVPPTGTSERGSVVEGGEVLSLDQLVAAEDLLPRYLASPAPNSRYWQEVETIRPSGPGFLAILAPALADPTAPT